MAMDDQATFWRVDGLFTRRISSAPDTQWHASAWAGGDRDKIRLQSSGILTDTGHIEGEGGTRESGGFCEVARPDGRAQQVATSLKPD